MKNRNLNLFLALCAKDPPSRAWLAVGVAIAQAADEVIKGRTRFDTSETLADHTHNLVRSALHLLAARLAPLVLFQRLSGEAYRLFVEGRCFRMRRRDGSIPGGSGAPAAVGQLSFPFAEDGIEEWLLLGDYQRDEHGRCARVTLHEVDASGRVERGSWVIWSRAAASETNLARKTHASPRNRDEISPIDEFGPAMVDKSEDGEPEGD